MKKQCAKCQSAFECLADDIKNCHCNAVSISKSALERLKNTYSNCLCNSCLKTISLEDKLKP